MAKMKAVDAAVHGARAGGRFGRLRRARRGDQSVLRGAAQARLDPPYPRAPCRGRVAHGRRLYARQGGQHWRLHRHLRPRRHRHDHWALRRRGELDPDPLHHRAGAASEALQGGFPGDRHRVDRQAGGEMGGDRARAGARADGVPAGVPCDAVGPSGTGADRPADRRADGRDRIRHRDLRAPAGLQAGGHESAGAARA